MHDEKLDINDVLELYAREIGALTHRAIVAEATITALRAQLEEVAGNGLSETD